MALNAKLKRRKCDTKWKTEQWLWIPKMVTQLWIPKTKKDGDSKCMNRYEKQLWMPKLKERSESKGLKEYVQWLWTPKWRNMVVDLNVERKIDMMTLSVELKTWLRTPNWKCGSECQTEDMAMKAEQKKSNGFERQDEDTTLNAKRKRWSRCRTRGKQRLWTPNKKWITNLNVRINMWLWTPNRKCDGSRCQNEKSGSERQTEDEQWL